MRARSRMCARVCALACALSHMHALMWPESLLLCLLAFTHTPRAFSLSRSTSTRRACVLTTLCRRVSLALRISSECTVDVCAEINAAAPPDQQRFYVSCEMTGLRSEKSYRLRPGAGVSLRAQSGGDNVSLFFGRGHQTCFNCFSSGGWSRKSRTLGSAVIHGETFVWSANITTKQVKYRVILWFQLTCVASLFWSMLVHVYLERASASPTLTSVDFTHCARSRCLAPPLLDMHVCTLHTAKELV